LRYLLDTHALLWFLANDARLSPHARNLIEAAGNDAFVSVVSLWEVAIKNSGGKLPLPLPFSALFPAQLDVNRITLLPIEIAHIEGVIRLPFHHRDSFDRLLIAQSQVENLPLISVDGAFAPYEVQVAW
jgi:PIN domain nuclease of toxin-antitoxin system